MGCVNMLRRAAGWTAVVLLTSYCILAAQESITGIIYGDECDDNGDIITVDLVVESGEDVMWYDVVMDTLGQELLAEMGNTVTVTGTVQGAEDGSKRVSIAKWTRVATATE